ncbi:iron-regulated protein A precursor [Bdellovibrio sp. ZAP7]|uniref:imelysin family protein n=1 Tax=Bdellovibrio sp. ZAP7 TaxID=2231053 RepID=UPI00115C3C4E|nr:imelysin family protein [Bdellovibrio sp. ZAP7]QDK44109.1 iron-regulated protein A precursor [Bdellovibrio sp. ZAP7]
MKALKLMTAALALVIGGQASAASNQEIITHVSYNVITATYVELAQATVSLKQAVDIFVQNPNEATLAQAQNAWRGARMPWEASEAFLFGPVDSLGIDPMLDTWPLNRLDLDAVLASGRTITPEMIRSLGTNLQGFHTIEYLLFGDGVHSNTKPISAFTAKQFEYLSSTAQVEMEHAAALAYAWTNRWNPEDASSPGYSAILAQPGWNNQFYTSDAAVLEELVKGMMAIADEVANGKIADPLGGDINSANMALVESPFSWNSLNDFTFNIRSIYSVYTGTYRTSQGPGVKALVERHDPQLAQQIEQHILGCMQLIQAIRPAGGGDFGQAIFTPDGRQRAQQAIQALNQLHAVLEQQVLPLVDK